MRRVTRYMRANRTNGGSSRRSRSQYVFSLLGAITMSVAGFICTMPFLWYMVFIGPESSLSLFGLVAIMLLVLGSPMFLMGLIGIAGKRFGGVSQAEMDIARIRFAAETQLMNDLFKETRK